MFWNGGDVHTVFIAAMRIVRGDENSSRRFNKYADGLTPPSMKMHDISAAVTGADATVLRNVAASMSFELTFALPALPINSS